MSWKLITAWFRRGEGEYFVIKFLRKNSKVKRSGEEAEDCSSVQYLLGKGLELQIQETACFCLISIFSISVLRIMWEWGGEMIWKDY